MTTEEKALASFVEERGVSMQTQFVGLNWVDEWKHFEWSVTLRRNGRAYVLPYRQGIAHATWKKGVNWRRETLSGVPHDARAGQRIPVTGNSERVRQWWNSGAIDPTAPTIDCVLDCLRSDVESIEFDPLFEDWASSAGYDTDSRKAESIYRACLETRGQLLKLLGREAYDELLTCERL